MAKAAQKIILSPSRDIPFDKLVLSQSNVRRIKAGVSVDELAEDIARRGLLQSLSVRPVLADDGTETGKFEIPAGGRRFQALSLLVKQKRLNKITPIPCIVRDAGSDILAEDDSLAENMQRVALHPLDQFRAFVALREKGQSDAEIAAAFFVTPQIVKQRLKLASVAPALLEVYAEDGMTLEQLMAFTVNPDHDRQVQVWDVINSSWNKEPFAKYLASLDPQTEFPDGLPFGTTARRITPHIYTDAEIQRILTDASQLYPLGGLRPSNIKTVIGLVAATGIRISEALGLQISDFDQTGSTLRVLGAKSRRERRLPLHPTVHRALTEHLRIRLRHSPTEQTAPLFISTWSGGPLPYATVLWARG